MGGFGWYLNPNHKHHISFMIAQYFLLGIGFLLIGFFGWDISEIITVIFYLFSGLSFGSSFYYITQKLRKKQYQQGK